MTRQSKIKLKQAMLTCCPWDWCEGSEAPGVPCTTREGVSMLHCHTAREDVMRALWDGITKGSK